jgi:hypothetical protein
MPQQDQRIGLWTAGLEFSVTIGFFMAGGYWLDKNLDIFPAGILLGLAAGFAVALYRLIRLARGAVGKNTNQQDDSQRR